jgi:Kef-type K+ transport system membrane component KefB
MESYTYLFAIAVILLSTKLFGLASQKIHMPAVVGSLVAGLILGPVTHLVVMSDFIKQTSEIGVILLMFLAGLETDLTELKKNGFASFVIACIGVAVPLAGGYVCYKIFYNNPSDAMNVLKAVFIGVTLTATSVSITVETLREMGKLQGRMGTTVLGAAVIDDILGIIVLTLITSMTDESVNPMAVIGKIVLFFVFVAAVAILVHFMLRLKKQFSKKRRFAIYSLAFCLIMAFCSEQFFGVADITGAYFAGVILCNLGIRDYIGRKFTILSYMFFSPIFFASVGLETDLAGFNMQLVIFSAVLLVVAILTKIIGCGLGAKLCKFNNKDALSIGIGMVSRGEVALIVAGKGAKYGLIDSALFPAIIIVVIVTTLITPILLKIILSDHSKTDRNSPDYGAPVPDKDTGDAEIFMPAVETNA